MLVAAGLLAFSALMALGLPGVRSQTVAFAHALGDVDVSSRDSVSAGRLMDGTMHSGTLGMDLPYRVYLPPGYFSTGARYPVLYMLHGGGAGYVEWTEKSHLGNIADMFIAQDRIPPMIIVMPEGDHSYYMNFAGRGPRWADFMTYDLISFIDFTYRTLPDREHRALGGLSMGGAGALQLAFNHPEVFSIVGAHSPSMYLSMENAPDFFGNWDYYAGFDPVRLASTRSGLESLQIWVDVGDQDAWLPGVEQLHFTLVGRGISHQWHLYQGTHDNSYWMDHIPAYLKFYSDALAGMVPPPPPTVAPPAAPAVPPTPAEAPPAEPPVEATTLPADPGTEAAPPNDPAADSPVPNVTVQGNPAPVVAEVAPQ